MEIINKDISIHENAYVTVTKTNSITELQYLQKRTPKGFCAIKNIGNNEYLLPMKDEGRILTEKIIDEDGKILTKAVFDESKKYTFERSENRAQNIKSLKRTMKSLRYKINNNFVGAKNELFLTLTYAKGTNDQNKLYRDFDVFIKRLKRYFSGFDLKYISVVEPHQNGNFHFHVLLKLPKFKGVLFIKNKVLSSIWEHGFVNVRRIKFKNVDNIGAYLTAYLSDIEVPIESSVGKEKIVGVNESGQAIKKKFVKGGRLHFYKTGMNFYRCSRNCSKPKRIILTYLEALKLNLGTKVFDKSYILVDDYGFEVNQIKFEVYNQLSKIE